MTYRLNVQCSALETGCGITTVTDVLDSNLTITAAGVTLPTGVITGELPAMTKAVSGQTVTVTLGNAARAFQGGTTLDIILVATVTGYPLTPEAGVIPNQAKLTSTATPDHASNIVKIKVTPPAKDWSLVKWANVSTTAGGEVVTYEIRWARPTRTGGLDIRSATFTDALDPRVEYISSVIHYGSPTSTTVYDPATHTVTVANTGPMDAQNPTSCDGVQCYSFTNVAITVRFPPNAKDGRTYPAGTIIPNTAKSTVVYEDGTTGTLEDTVHVSLEAVTRAIYGYKNTGYATNSIPPGGALTWNIYAINNGNATQTDFTVIDKLPTDPTGAVPIDNLEVLRSNWQYYPLAPNRGLVTVDFGTDGVNFSQPTVIDASTLENIKIPVPDGMTYIRFRVASFLPGQIFQMYITGTVPTTASLDDSLKNCATYSATGVTTFESCSTITVDPLTTTMLPRKYAVYPAGKTAFQPGETFEWVFGFSTRGPLPIKTATISDLIPPEFEFLGVNCFSKSNSYLDLNRATCGAGSLPIPAYTAVPQYDAAGTFLGTLVTFKDWVLPFQDEQFGLGYFFKMDVKVRPGTSIKSYTNEVLVSTNDANVACESGYGSFSRPDGTDIDGDRNTTETTCGYPSKVLVVEAAVINLTKWDKGTKGNVFESTGTTTSAPTDQETECPDWDGYTRYPCVAITDPGSDFDYRLRLQNAGNVEMTNYVVYDILPVVGDTGVGQLLSGEQRKTEWSPVLTGPITLNANLSATNPSGYLVEYNLTSNPCRPELNKDLATADQPWQGGACDDTWYTAGQINDWKTVKSFRITMFQPDTSTSPTTYPLWHPGDTYVYDVPMKAPLSAQTSTLDPLDLSVAWNSAAHRVYRTMTGAEPTWEQPSEPRKVGVIVPFAPPVAVSVGDYVWMDNNGNGLQDEGDTPVEKVPVTLYAVNDDGTKGAWQASTVTNGNGYYSFVNLTPDTDYIIEFTKPAGLSFTTQNADNVTDNSRDKDLNDSDADRATGQVKFTSGPAGKNLPGGPTMANAVTDNPGIDAGFVSPRMNLQLKKSGGTWTGLLLPGTEVTWTLTPNNEGSTTAEKYWSVTDILPAGMELVSMTGPDYTCDTAATAAGTVTCVSNVSLAAGATGKPITVVTKVAAGWTGSSFRNVAYVDKATTDQPETNPLVTPTRDTDTTKSPTDNDAEASINVVSVGDYVWWDTNRDGLQTAGEAAIKDVAVTLYAADGTVIATTKTDETGHYAFTGLKPGTAYEIGFDKSSQAGASYTKPNAGGVTTNSKTGDLTDSDAVPADATTNIAKVSFTSEATGSNSSAAGQADNPGIDAGLVKFNLVLEKTLSTPGPFFPGKSVTFSLTAKNEGPTDALAGWSVTDILPTGLTATAITPPTVNGSPMASCDLATLTCTYPSVLAAGATGLPMTVTATIDSTFSGSAINVAYVAPSSKDVPETNPLVKPVKDQDISNPLTPTDNDAMAPLTVPKVSIGDYVWWDTNRDGKQGDPAVEKPVKDGFVVKLYDANGAYLRETTTSGGYYAFKDLTPNTQYTVEFVRSAASDTANASFTTPNAGSPSDTSNSPTSDLTDSDAHLVTGKVTLTTPNTGRNLTDPNQADNHGIDAGLVSINLQVAKSGGTWKGVLVPGTEVTWTVTPTNAGPSDALGGWTVTDRVPTGMSIVSMGGMGYTCDITTTPTDPVCTSADGLAVGASGAPITVVTKVNAGWTGSAFTNVAYVSPSSKDVPETNVLVVPERDKDVTNPATPTDNDASVTIHVVSVGDYVWYDRNRDGQQGDPTVEPVVEDGMIVRLLNADGTPVKNAADVPVTTTTSGGYYAFTGLLPSTAYVVEFVKPANTVFTTAFQGDQATDSNADVVTGRAPVTTKDSGNNSGEPRQADTPTIDAGLVELVSIGDYVWWDINRDGLQGDPAVEKPVEKVVVNLLDANGNPAVLPGGAKVTTVTDANGFYSFNNLIAGVTYQVEFVKPADTIFTTQDVTGVTSNDKVADAADSDAHVFSGRVTVVAPATGDNKLDAPDNPSIDAGLIELVSIGDVVWWDINRDGLQGDPAVEKPVAGVVVNLLDANGNPAVLPGGAKVTTVTDANGFYSFNNLIAGVAYQVQFVKPDQTVFTTANVTGITDNTVANDSKDSDANVANGTAPFIAPATGTNSLVNPDNPTLDAGLIELVSVGDYVWMDNNRDGQQSAGEPAVEGVTVKIFDDKGTLWDTTVTNDKGFYSFTDLLAGATYTIEFVKPDGTTFTTPMAGTNPAIDSNAPADGRYQFSAPATGNNSALTPDDPTIDAGLVKFNLTLTKERISHETVFPGDTVTFKLTPHNDGPSAALPGWSVTDVMPAGLTLVAMWGDNYRCSDDTCVSFDMLAPRSDGAPVFVKAKVDAGFTGKAKNVAYVAPSRKDVPETNPLGPIPTTDTNTKKSPTDNDDEAWVTVEAVPLPQTGSDITPVIWLASLLVLAGAGAVMIARPRRRTHGGIRG
ncbi:MAG: SdrD B-like domain-containing protein [Dermatophilaceae bacterium]